MFHQNPISIRKFSRFTILLTLIILLSGCSWPLLRSLPFVGESYSSPKWASAKEDSEPELETSLQVILGTQFMPGNNITTYVNGSQIFPAMLDSIRNAQHYIYLETYIAWEGKTAKQFVEALSERAKAGVKVQVILDWHGSQELGGDMIDKMEEAGVQIVLYNSLKWFNPLSWKGLGNLDNRTHRRILLIDGKYAYTGGVGLADEWNGNAGSKNEWRDTHYKVEGPAVSLIEGVFVENWWASEGEYSLKGKEQISVAAAGMSRVQVAKSFPRIAIPSTVVTLSAAINAARDTIRISTPYFVPEDTLLEDMVKALKRGVKIEIIVPGYNSDKEIVRTASRGLWGALLKNGAKIFEYLPTFYHCKLLVVDGKFVSFGTANWDSRSLRLNDEIIVNVIDANFASEQISIFEADKTQSQLITYSEWQKRPFWERVSDTLSGSLRNEL